MVDNGIKTEADNAIKFRKWFIENKPIDFIDKLSDEKIAEGLEFITNEEYTIPFVGDNQKNVLLQLHSHNKSILKSEIDFEKICKESTECDSKEYKNWRSNSLLQIFHYDNQIPKSLNYKEKRLIEYNEDDYCYNKTEKVLFVNKNKNIDDLLFEIAREGKCDFTLEDYKILCKDGKTTISTEELDQKNKKIEDLESENENLRRELEKYKPQNTASNQSESITNTISSHTPIETNQDVIERDELSKEEQIEAHKEAERVIKEKLESDGYDCSNWILDESFDEDEVFCSVNQKSGILNPDGKEVKLVVKSVKGGYIYLSATDFEFLTSDSKNILMVWDGKKTQSVTANQIFNKDSNVNLIFDTEYTPKHYYAALSKVFQYIKRTHFAVKNPTYSAYDQTQSFGQDSKTEGVQELFDDNDI